MCQVDADARPSSVGPPFTGHFKIIADTPRGLQPWQPSTDPVVTQGIENEKARQKATKPAKAELNLEIGRNIYEPNAKEVAPKSKQPADSATNGDSSTANGTGDALMKDLEKESTHKVNCCTCGIDCTRVHYHNPTTDGGKAKFDVCPNCYVEGRLPHNQSQSQFVKLENATYSAIRERDASWDDGELLRLLEAVERFDEDWNQVSEHVATRTPEECVLKFLQLDIEDKYIDSEPAVNGPSSLGLLGTQGGHLPFSRADNPVMSVVGFLAGLTEPSVTAAAAGKSVMELKRSLQAQLDKEGDDGAEAVTNGASYKGKEKEVDAMDIDIRQEISTTTTTTQTVTQTIKTLASVPLVSAAVRGAGLAAHEEREMSRHVGTAVNLTLQKLELKLQQFNDMETLVQAERRELERGRQQLFLDRLEFRKRVKDVQEGFKAAASSGGPDGFRIAEAVVNRSERLSFAPAAVNGGMDGVQPLSAQGQIKSYEI